MVQEGLWGIVSISSYGLDVGEYLQVKPLLRRLLSHTCGSGDNCCLAAQREVEVEAKPSKTASWHQLEPQHHKVLSTPFRHHTCTQQ